MVLVTLDANSSVEACTDGFWKAFRGVCNYSVKKNSVNCVVCVVVPVEGLSVFNADFVGPIENKLGP